MKSVISHAEAQKLAKTNIACHVVVRMVKWNYKNFIYIEATFKLMICTKRKKINIVFQINLKNA